MTRTERFLSTLRAGGVLVSDGATGTMLQKMGLEPGDAPETWIFAQPDKIRALHRGYVQAGSDVILTCTFGGTRYRLARHDLAEQVIDINRRAAELARDVAGGSMGLTTSDVFVAGSMGPTGELLKPLGKATPQGMTAAFADQAQGLAEGGADFLLVETMSDLGEAQAAIQGARQVSGLPIICTFSFDTFGRTVIGYDPQTVAKKIGPLVQGIGANCGKDPAEYVGFVDDMQDALEALDADLIMWTKPNAGLPHMVDEQIVYDASPQDMAQTALQLRQAGAQVIGGCCGTTPEHVTAIANALKETP